MSVTHGGNVPVMQQIADELASAASELDQVRSHAMYAVRVMTEAWQGADQLASQNGFARCGHDLGSASDIVATMAKHVRAQAQQQEATSASRGPVTGFPTTPHTPLPTTPSTPTTPTAPGLDGATTQDGPPIPNVIGDQPMFGDDQPWVPQGYAYDPESGLLITTSYGPGEGGEDSEGLITLQDRDGNVVAQIPISGNNHYGGAGTDGTYVYVSGNGAGGDPTVQVYSLAALRSGAADASTPIHSFKVDTGSAITVHDGHLYAAAYSKGGPGTLYRYALSDGQRVPGADRTWTIPGNVNGVAIDGDRAYVSQNYGRASESAITSISLTGAGSGTGEGRVKMPSMIEGITFVDGQIWSTYESGAGPYNDEPQLAALDPDWEPRRHTTITTLDR